MESKLIRVEKTGDDMVVLDLFQYLGRRFFIQQSLEGSVCWREESVCCCGAVKHVDQVIIVLYEVRKS